MLWNYEIDTAYGVLKNTLHDIHPIHWAVSRSRGHRRLIEFFATSIENPNVSDPNKFGETPIYIAASNGYVDVIKVLAPLTENPNAANVEGRTPILQAALYGHTNIIEFLAPLTKSPNAPSSRGLTPIQAARMGWEIHRRDKARSDEIVNILRSYQ